MAQENQELERLRAEVDKLLHEVERYRTASEDIMQQLDWCIGYFTGTNKTKVARTLSANRNHIRRTLLRRSEQTVPVNEG